MSPSSSPSTPLSSALRSPYASFFDLQKIFHCGCTSDVDIQELKQSQSVDFDEHDESPITEERTIETAKDCFDRISDQLTEIDITKRNITRAKSIAKRSSSDPTITKKMNSSLASTVFRLTTDSKTHIARSRRRLRFPSLKKTDSDSTQSTIGLSDDEDDLSLASTACEDSDDEAAVEEAPPTTVSILRRKVKLGVMDIKSTGATVRFCPTTVFPDPNVPYVRRKIKRLPKELRTSTISPPIQPLLSPIITSPSSSHESDKYSCELRRLRRRAQQNQHHLYITNEIRSPSTDMLLPTESFYVFR